jgi:hypothetical protein
LDETTASLKRPDKITLILRWVLGALGIIGLLTAAWCTYAYFTTPAAIRQPAHAHYHFRMQIVVDGTQVNFADTKYQTGSNKDICSAALTAQPVHFHDGLDQFVHIHWGRTTGGLVLKNYGWNYLGTTNRTLGYRFDQLPKLVRVPIHGSDLPKPPTGARYYVYVSSVKAPADYWEQSWDDFLRLDLKDFFSAKPQSKHSWLGRLVPAVSARAGEDQGRAQELAKLNDVLGNIVIFAQKNPPTAAQIKDRFAHLVPLPESSCGG